jgi:uncharacterized protein YhbP (UPF0306 family)
VTEDERQAIRQMLDDHSTLTLATCHDGKPWAASLFFASDARLNLYFVSDYRTRHARDLAECDEAIVTVNPDCSRWSEVQGLQVSGRVTVVTGASRVKGIAIYLAKFADVKAVFEAPASKDEETIAQRLKAANLYRLKPRWIRLIDNSKWFGYKQEFEL